MQSSVKTDRCPLSGAITSYLPEDKIRARYARNGGIIRQAIFLADAGSVYDNSVNGWPSRLILDFRTGPEIERRPPLPAWVTDIYD